jgi:hypothetical protein
MDDCMIFHYGQDRGEGEKLVIVELGEQPDDYCPEGYRLVSMHEAEIHASGSLPLGRVLTRDR